MAKEGKRVAFAESPKPTKRVAIAKEVGGYYDQRPRWRVAKMELCAPYGWHELASGDFQEIRKCLADLEALDWKTIIQQRGDHHHYCRTDKFSADARKRLRELKLDDLDELFRLRVTKVKRLWGFLNPDGVFDILWWDPEHQVYPYEKPNT